MAERSHIQEESRINSIGASIPQKKPFQFYIQIAEPESKINKQTFFIVWIEGLSPKNGEKIMTLNSKEHTYTTKMTQALRVLPEDVERVRGILRSRGVAEWALGDNSFIKTDYAPMGTIYRY